MTQERQHKFEKLKTLGRPTADWQDYLQYGFNNNDIEGLLAVVKQNTLFSLLISENEIWASVYAWRVLGQLGDEKIVSPLVAVLNQFSLSNDDYSAMELPLVFSMLGKPAIKPLMHFLSIKTNEEQARVIASDALAEIAKKDSSLHLDIIYAYDYYLQNPDNYAYDLNGLTVANLMDIKAVELLEPIRHMFADNIVNDSICGTLKEVENKINGENTRALVQVQANDCDEFPFEYHKQIIQNFFEKYASEHSLQNISELDGYLAAIVCSDLVVSPSIWAIDIWGGKEHLPQCQDEAEFEEFNNSVFAYFHYLCTQMRQGEYLPLIIEDENGKTYPYIWCLGFVDASESWHKAVEDLPLQALLGFSMIAILAGSMPEDKMRDLNLEYDALAQSIVESVAIIYHELRNNKLADEFVPLLNDLYEGENYPTYQSEQPYVRGYKKVGRNEPCLCGSGKKYKKCCINK